MIRNRFEEIAALSELGLCAVIGNDDFPNVRSYICGKKVHNVQEEPFVFGDYAIIGIEGAIDDPKDRRMGIGYTLYTESQLKNHLQNLKNKIRDKKLIILSHSPPRDVLDLAYRFGMGNIGSKTLRQFVEENHTNIPLVVCGHVHLQGGRSMKVGKTSIVNAASHDSIGAPGRIASINIQDNSSIEISWNEMYGIDGIHSIGPVRSQKFKEAGIRTIDDLFGTSIEKLSACLGCGPQYTSKILVRAKAVYEKKVIALSEMGMVEDNAVYLDIETDLRQELVWLIGLYFPRTDEFFQLVAHTPKEEKLILNRFLDKIKRFQGKIYTFSNTKFDERVLKKRMDHYKLDYSTLPEFIDLAMDIQRAFAFPLKSYGLKSIADYFGYEYRHQDLNGMIVALEYMHTYQKTKDKKLLKRLLEYNEDDIRSLPWIMKKLMRITRIEVEKSEHIHNVRVRHNGSHG